MTCVHDKTDDYATCLVCQYCGAVGHLTPSLRKQRLCLIWTRTDKTGRPLEILGIEGLGESDSN